MQMANFYGQLVDILANTNDSKLVDDFLKGILTAQEREELPKRLEIVKQLLAGKPQAEIAESLGVGIATVTRGSKELKQGHFKVLKEK